MRDLARDSPFGPLDLLLVLRQHTLLVLRGNEHKVDGGFLLQHPPGGGLGRAEVQLGLPGQGEKKNISIALFSGGMRPKRYNWLTGDRKVARLLRVECWRCP